MARDLTFTNFLKELGMRIGAAAIVVGIFFGLAHINRTDFLGVSRYLGTQTAFFTTAFLLIGIITTGWIVFWRGNR